MVQSLRYTFSCPWVAETPELRRGILVAHLIAVLRPPFLHQRVEVVVPAFRQYDAERHEQVAAIAAGARNSLALEAKGPSAARLRRHGQRHRSVEGRHAHLRAEHRLVEGDGDVAAEVIALGAEH